jgi:hypothetical protein
MRTSRCSRPIVASFLLAGALAGCSGSGESGPLPLPEPQSLEAGITRIATRLSSAEFLGRDEGTPGGIAARAYLLEEWKACGIEPLVDGGYEQPILTGKGANILGRIRGTDPSLADRHVLVSAHYDHLGEDCDDGPYCPGAYDNAAAVGIVIQVACGLAANPPARSVIVAHWDAEEPPTVRTDKMGSNFYAANPLIPLSSLDASIVLDLTGTGMWPGYGGHFVMGSETSPQLTALVASATVPDGLTIFRGSLHTIEEQSFGHHPWSDYDAFRNAGVPVLFLSDGQTKVYHLATDTIDKVDMAKAGREASYLAGLVRTLAEAEVTPVFAPADDYLHDARTVTAILEDALLEGGGVSLLGLQPESIASLQGDSVKLAATLARLEGGATATADDIAIIRIAVQRVMCLASQLPDFLCQAL